MDSGSTSVRVLAPERSPPGHGARRLGHLQCVLPGDEIPVDAGFVRGHGTLVEDGRLVATVAGLVEHVNKLVAVRPLRAKYAPEIGDVVVGRVVEVAQKRWRVDINSRQHAALMLSAVNLPGGVQRRRTYEDELNMRAFFGEDDLISAEIQEIRQDGSVALHTRSLKYGKLEVGELVVVPPQLVKRSQKHFHDLPCGIKAILGNNGFVWMQVAGHRAADGQRMADGDDDNDDDEVDDKEQEAQRMEIDEEITMQERTSLARARNAVEVLSRCFISIHAETIMDVYTESEQLEVSVQDMLLPHVAPAITTTASTRRELPS